MSATLNIDSALGIYLKKIKSFYGMIMSLINTKTSIYICSTTENVYNGWY